MQSQFETMALTESGTGYYPRRRSRSRAEGSNLLGFAFETEHRGKSHSRLGVKSAVSTFYHFGSTSNYGHHQTSPLGPVNKRPCINRTGTNEAANRHNLLTQGFTAVGALIASGAPWCVAGISAV